MRMVFVLFDSLNRHALGAYGGTAIPTPNFDRLSRRAAVFDTHYAGSLPCMPARRDLHTGRLNFLHRGWSPLEPYDTSYAALLQKAGVYSHLISDHFHYFEDGGATYHQRYSSWDYIRGQEKDKWKALVEPPIDRFKAMYHPMQHQAEPTDGRLNYMINREYIKEEADFPSVKCFDAALEFLETNGSADNWLLHLETFDPHEPFHAPERLRKRFPSGYDGPILDWPRYKRTTESTAEIAEIRANYAALLTLCDEQLGRLLDVFDEQDLWKDTALIVTTDHGFLLGEHEWWAKNVMPFYEEISHIPLFFWHPEHRCDGRRKALTQTIDLMPTILDCFGVQAPATVTGRSLLPVLDNDSTIRDVAIFGMFGGATNVTDGRYVYFRYPTDMVGQELYEYVLIPLHMKSFFSTEELSAAELVDPFDFTQGMPLLKVPAYAGNKAKEPPQGLSFKDSQTVLYDLLTDPTQVSPIDDGEVVGRLTAGMMEIMRLHDAPDEAFRRLEL
ncbi:sulfatase [Azospirillum lipoferum]|uniref:Sulfatase n=2 Tax=Azospirillum lipoferum TaxID=193 RepID=A0A5A9GRU3_AZOLI|nr:sulfatase [Azospirillum sp. NL1]KAA0596039.1 sulfatase [Azospirillum lipoferum]MDW5533902.1 sulfatase [Azospirillum sp. NL1]